MINFQSSEKIDFDKFKETIGGDLKTAHTKSIQLNSFGNISLFRILSDEKIEFLQNNLKIICVGSIYIYI